MGTTKGTTYDPYQVGFDGQFVGVRPDAVGLCVGGTRACLLIPDCGACSKECVEVGYIGMFRHKRPDKSAEEHECEVSIAAIGVWPVEKCHAKRPNPPPTLKSKKGKKIDRQVKYEAVFP
jgi:hypothetical protein